MTPFELDLRLPRNAFGPRDTARAGDLWRAAQDAAIAASTDRGWPPERYRAEGAAFVVRGVFGAHRREVRFGEPIRARTWVADFRRDTFTARQVQLLCGDDVVFEGVQQWVHVSMPEGRMVRASPALRDSFEVGVWAAEPVVPEFDTDTVPPEGFAFETWHVSMDPLAHLNHPAYVDLADEAVARWVAARGGDPQAIVPVAERVAFRLPVRAPERVQVVVEGVRGDVFAVAIRLADGRAAADVALRRGAAGPEADLARRPAG